VTLVKPQKTKIERIFGKNQSKERIAILISLELTFVMLVLINGIMDVTVPKLVEDI